MKLRSLYVFHLDTGACNGCEIELFDILTPYYDAERLGVRLAASPRHAHAMAATGPLTRQAYYAAKEAIKAMPPKPRIIVAIGTCACSGGIFYNGYPVYRRPESGREGQEYPRRGGIFELVQDLRDEGEYVGPVVYIPGCPPRPEEILYGVALALGLVEKQVKGEYYTEEVGFELPEYPIEERIRLSLRERLKYVVGYFDREKVLEDFMGLVAKAKSAEELHGLIQGYCLKNPDPRVSLAMRVLEREFLRLKEKYGWEVKGSAKAPQGEVRGLQVSADGDAGPR
jgi:Ni,Fe-hydrogenase III small subunit